MKQLSFVRYAVMLTFSIFFASYCNAQANLTDSVKIYSNLFKSLDGAAREQVFVKKLSSSIRTYHPTDQAILPSNLMGANFTTRNEILMLLGNPNRSLPDAIDEYYLSPIPTTNKLVVIYDSNSNVVSVTIKN
jgi:hypothetical protein